MRVHTETINGRVWHIAELSKRDCKHIGLEYPTYCIWEHDKDYDYFTENGQRLSLQVEDSIVNPYWWWANAETDADNYDEAIKWCSQFSKEY